MIFLGVDQSAGAGTNWKDGLRELNLPFLHKLKIDQTSLSAEPQKIAQYLEREPGFERCKEFKKVLSLNAQLFSRLLQNPDEKRVVVGGDHSIGLATVEASLASLRDGEKLNIIWIDAHGDYNSPESSRSGNIHGMPLYYLLNKSSYHKRVNKVFLIGTSDLDDPEFSMIENDPRIENISYQEIGDLQSLIRKMSRLSDSWGFHLSFDIDVLPLQQAPGTGCQLEVGVDWAVLKELFHLALQGLEIKAIDIVEYNPDLDKGKKTRNIVLELVDLIRYSQSTEQFDMATASSVISTKSAKKPLQNGPDYIM
jgi:arginase